MLNMLVLKKYLTQYFGIKMLLTIIIYKGLKCYSEYYQFKKNIKHATIILLIVVNL